MQLINDRWERAPEEGGSSPPRKAPCRRVEGADQDDDMFEGDPIPPDDEDTSAQDPPTSPIQPAAPASVNPLLPAPASVWNNLDDFRQWLTTHEYSTWLGEDWQNYSEMQWRNLTELQQSTANEEMQHVWDTEAFDACMLVVGKNTNLKPDQWTASMLSEWTRRGMWQEVLDASCTNLRREAMQLVGLRIGEVSNSSPSWLTWLTSGPALRERLSRCREQRWTPSEDAAILLTQPAQGHLPRVEGMPDLSSVFDNYSSAALSLYLSKTDVSNHAIVQLLKMLGDPHFHSGDIAAQTPYSLFGCMHKSGIQVEVLQVDFTQPCDNLPVTLFHVECFKALSQVIHNES